jgi:hypothetical protein
VNQSNGENENKVVETKPANTIKPGIRMPNPVKISASERKIPNPNDNFFGTISKFWMVSAVNLGFLILENPATINRNAIMSREEKSS